MPRASRSKTGAALPAEAEGDRDSWLPGIIEKTSDSVRQALIVYLGFAAYCALTLSAVTDRDLLLDSSATLPLLNTDVPLATFGIAGPLLALLLFLYLHVSIIGLADLLVLSADTKVAGRVRHGFINGFLLRRLKIIPPSLSDKLQFPVLVLVLYISLPLLFGQFAIVYAKLRVPALSVALGLSPIFVSVASAAFYLAVADPRFERTWAVIHDNRSGLVAILLLSFVPFVLVELPLELSFYPILIAALPLFIGLAALALVLLLKSLLFPPESLTRGQAVLAILSKVALLFVPWLFVLAMAIFAALIVDADAHATLGPIWIGLCILFAIWVLRGAGKIANPGLLTFLLIGSVAQHCVIGLLREAGDGKVLTLDVSYEELVPVSAARTATTASLNLSGRNLSGASMRYSSLSRVHFRGAHLVNADFRGADLRWADFTGANLADANLSGALLEGAVFRNATLARTRFEQANLTGALFERSELAYSHMGDALLTDARFMDVGMIYAHGLTGPQMLRARSLLYSRLPSQVEREVLQAKPELLFHDEPGLERPWEGLFHHHRPGAVVTLDDLAPNLVSLSSEAERYPPWKRTLYVQYHARRLAALLEQRGFLRRRPDGRFDVQDGGMRGRR